MDALWELRGPLLNFHISAGAEAIMAIGLSNTLFTEKKISRLLYQIQNENKVAKLFSEQNKKKEYLSVA